MVRVIVEIEFITEHADGCFEYQIREDVNDTNVVIIYEEFGGKSAQDFHRESAHYKEILQEQLPSMIKNKKARFLDVIDLTNKEI